MKEKRLRRIHTREFKLQCCRQVATAEKSVPPREYVGSTTSQRERAVEVAQGVRGSRRDGFYREATLWRGSSPGEDSRAGAFLRTALPGEPDLKKVACEHELAKRHAVIEQVREEYPEISIERLCELMGVSRSWYYERSTAGKKAHRDADLRDGRTSCACVSRYTIAGAGGPPLLPSAFLLLCVLRFDVLPILPAALALEPGLAPDPGLIRLAVGHGG